MRTIIPAVAFLLSALLLVHPPPAAGQCTPDWQLGANQPAPVVALAPDGDAIVEACVDDLAAVSTVYRVQAGARTQLGPAFAGRIRTLLAGPEGIIAAGSFSAVGGDPMANIARWDGTAWRSFGAGVPGGVQAIVVHQGSLLAATSPPIIVRWDGSTWQPFGPPTGGLILCLLSWNDALYVGGSFGPSAGSIIRVLRLDADNWIPVGQGLSHVVFALTPYNNELVAGGYFGIPGPFHGVARFDGQTWQPLGAGPGTPVSGLACAGADLYAAGALDGSFEGIARWDGHEWTPVGSGLDGSGSALLYHRGTLYVGGRFTTAGGQPSAYLARYVCPCYANCDGSAAAPALNINDFICFTNHFLAAGSLPTEQQVSDYANCDFSTEPPILTIADFVCFQQAFASGCK